MPSLGLSIQLRAATARTPVTDDNEVAHRCQSQKTLESVRSVFENRTQAVVRFSTFPRARVRHSQIEHSANRARCQYQK
jgi:hypothetical protein